MPMPDGCLPLINTIQHNIIISQTLIQELKKFIDVTDHVALVEKVKARLRSLREIKNVVAADIIKLVEIRVDLNIFVNELQRSLCALQFNEHYLEELRGFAPEILDYAINNSRIESLSIYVCGQSKIIENMLAFCNQATNANGKIFEFFKKDDIESKWLGIRDVRLGVCFGLGTLFLLCSFITDMQQYKTVDCPEDDLRWFYRCIVLLQLQPYKYSISQQQDVTRFISLIMHLQNIKISYGVDFNIFDTNKEISFSQQCSNLFNITFSGKNHIEYLEKTSINDPGFINLVLKASEPLYIMLVLHDEPNPGHLTVLLKNSSGEFKFYDPSIGLRDVVLSSESDYLVFKNKYLFTKQDTVSVIVGIGRKNQCDSSIAHKAAENSPKKSKKRLRIN